MFCFSQISQWCQIHVVIHLPEEMIEPQAATPKTEGCVMLSISVSGVDAAGVSAGFDTTERGSDNRLSLNYWITVGIALKGT